MKKSQSFDLSASINQTVADKLLSSVVYPFTVFEVHKPFEQKADGTTSGLDHCHTQTEAAEIFISADNSCPPDMANPDKVTDESFVLGGIFRNVYDIVENAKQFLASTTDATPDQKRRLAQSIMLAKQIVDAGVAGFAQTRGVQLVEHLAWLKVVARTEPTLLLNSPKISLNDINLLVSATGETWLYHPWFSNHHIIWQWDRIASITINDVRIAADAHADTSVAGTSITVHGVVDKLRLDYIILREIPIEGIANNALGNKPLFVFDASQFVATVPVINHSFTISDVSIPPQQRAILVQINIKKV